MMVWCMQHVVEHAAQRVAGLGVRGGHLDGLGDGDAQRPGAVGIGLEDGPAGGGQRCWASGGPSRRRSPSSAAGTASGRRRPRPARSRTPGRTGRRRRPGPCPTGRRRSRWSASARRPWRCSTPAAPRCWACASRPARRPRTCSRSGPACRGPAPSRWARNSGRRPPLPVDVEHGAGDVDVPVLAHLLEDEVHREQRREVVGPGRLRACPGAAPAAAGTAGRARCCTRRSASRTRRG